MPRIFVGPACPTIVGAKEQIEKEGKGRRKSSLKLMSKENTAPVDTGVMA